MAIAQAEAAANVSTGGGTPALYRTWQAAPTRTAVTVSQHTRKSSVAQSMTLTEQYWAARALTAEALLSAKTMHHKELNTLSSEAETKRATELTTLRQIHEKKESTLEKLVLYLSAAVILLVGTVIYSLSSGATATRKSSAVHFTIPILSPFASVVEHETSVIGSKVLTIFGIILAICLYGCFRYWLSRRIIR